MLSVNSSWLQPLRFQDGRELPDRILPGPMDGITEGCFLSVLTRAGLVRSWFTPFLRISNGTPRASRLKRWTEPYFSTGLPCIVQIMGTRIPHLAETAAALHELGAVCVDLNCGCPSPAVIGSRSGGYALKNPHWIADALQTMRQACGLHGISVKIRMGFSSVEEFPGIAEALREAKPDFVTCHFRTVQEMYSPVSGGRRRLAVAKALLPGIPFIASGDLFSLEDAEECRKLGMDGVAPARGFVQNPFLLQTIRQWVAGESPASSSRECKQRLLLAMQNCCGKPLRQQGFLLRMARMMFGEDAPETIGLLEQIRRSAKFAEVQPKSIAGSENEDGENIGG